MNRRRVVQAIVGVTVTAALASPARAETSCRLTFNLAGWSAFYKTASGSGFITCDNGQRASVLIRSTGGGLTFGKSKVTNGHGTFSQVENINELFGNYATGEAHAGAGSSAAAHVMTKGPVSLALAGTGQGVDLGFAFGKFTISKRR
jgi:hypothetical protein